ncbi:hypothetical protein CCR95_05390 [Thiocystis minor]|uniref:hypothetical protein n=1 Tax=Thiocystis minor TaxID=61597 RepID=UPI001913842F|nr:hypothetical protein [Thiocystis minor]MBK5963537.1 hypothetical protein [Thiocystis minor]
MNAPAFTLTELLRARLLAAAPAGLTASEMTKSLQPLRPDTTGAAWSRALADALAPLQETGQLERQGASRWRLTTAGREAGLAWLSVRQTAKPLSWPQVRNIALQARALGLPPPRTDQERKQLASADGLRAAILAVQYSLPGGPYPTLAQARNALLWWLLLAAPENPRHRRERWPAVSGQRFMHNAPKILLNDLLGTASDLPVDNALKQLVAQSIGARRTDVNELRLTVLRRALADAVPDAPATLAAPDQATPASVDLAAFAATVIQTARTTATGRFGEDKIFISHVWERLREAGRDAELTETQFKERLAEANRQGLLRLSRADLAYTLDPDDVARSELRYLTATFHFIRLD